MRNASYVAKVCNTDDKAKISSTPANPPITQLAFFTQVLKDLFIKAQRNLYTILDLYTTSFFLKGYVLNLWVLPAFFPPVRTFSLSYPSTPTKLKKGRVAACLPSHKLSLSYSAGSHHRRPVS